MKSRIRITVNKNNGHPFVEFKDMDTGKTETRDVRDAEMFLFEIEREQADKLFREVAFLNDDDADMMARIDDGKYDEERSA